MPGLYGRLQVRVHCSVPLFRHSLSLRENPAEIQEKLDLSGKVTVLLCSVEAISPSAICPDQPGLTSTPKTWRHSRLPIDARQREIKTGDKWTPRVLAGAMVLAWFSIEGFLLHQAFRGGPEPSSAMSQIVGSISRMADGAVTLVLGYYFGSSAGRDHSTGVEQENAQ
jgi:hypothetical protein